MRASEEQVKLRGMAWDHPRATNPLRAISDDWSKTSGVPVVWDARPLKAFEDQPLEELAQGYDLILIDHPFVGFAATSELIVPVDDWVEPSYLADQANHSVGPSYQSYTWNGKQWALAIDAACQVSAVRDDLLASSQGESLPNTWEEVVTLAERCHDCDHKAAIPLNPNHAYCAFLAIGTCAAGEKFWRPGMRVDEPAAHYALEILRTLASKVHPLSRESDPIRISDFMSRTNEIAYVPLLFGYSSYAREGFRTHKLRFANAPMGSSRRHGSVLGGVGLALSARSLCLMQAAELARRIATPEIQSGIYADAGGQPGHGVAWDSCAVNRETNGFFQNTRATIQDAFVRPRVAGHRRFQVEVGELIQRCIWERELTSDNCLKEYGRLADVLLGEWK